MADGRFTEEHREGLKEFLDNWTDGPPPHEFLQGSLDPPVEFERVVLALRMAFEPLDYEDQQEMVAQLWELVSLWSTTRKP